MDAHYDRSAVWSPAPIADCRLRPLTTVHRRDGALLAQLAATLERAGEALRRLEAAPGDRGARERAFRELGRISGYIETMVDALEHHLDGRKLTGVKRRLELLWPGVLHRSVVAGRKPTHT
jgi:hypothetical protein